MNSLLDHMAVVPVAALRAACAGAWCARAAAAGAHQEEMPPAAGAVVSRCGCTAGRAVMEKTGGASVRVGSEIQIGASRRDRPCWAAHLYLPPRAPWSGVNVRR